MLVVLSFFGSEDDGNEEQMNPLVKAWAARNNDFWGLVETVTTIFWRVCILLPAVILMLFKGRLTMVMPIEESFGVKSPPRPTLKPILDPDMGIVSTVRINGRLWFDRLSKSDKWGILNPSFLLFLHVLTDLCFDLSFWMFGSNSFTHTTMKKGALVRAAFLPRILLVCLSCVIWSR
jgi:hypothetical protein